jgi:hypothetical protein
MPGVFAPACADREAPPLPPHHARRPPPPPPPPPPPRQFYVCARPDGPPGVGRCDYFLWAENWDARSGTVKPGGGGRGTGRGGGRGRGR